MGTVNSCGSCTLRDLECERISVSTRHVVSYATPSKSRRAAQKPCIELEPGNYSGIGIETDDYLEKASEGIGLEIQLPAASACKLTSPMSGETRTPFTMSGTECSPELQCPMSSPVSGTEWSPESVVGWQPFDGTGDMQRVRISVAEATSPEMRSPVPAVATYQLTSSTIDSNTAETPCRPWSQESWEGWKPLDDGLFDLRDLDLLQGLSMVDGEADVVDDSTVQPDTSMDRSGVATHTPSKNNMIDLLRTQTDPTSTGTAEQSAELASQGLSPVEACLQDAHKKQVIYETFAQLIRKEKSHEEVVQNVAVTADSDALAPVYCLSASPMQRDMSSEYDRDWSKFVSTSSASPMQPVISHSCLMRSA